MKTWLQDLLKKVLGNGFLVLLIVSIFYILYLRECKRPPECPPKGQVLVSQPVWDSIQALANMQPIIHYDTIVGPTVYVPTTPANPLPQPKPEPKDTTINNYSDTLLKSDINVIYSFSVKGSLKNRTWSYKPIVFKEIDSIPYPKIIDRPVLVNVPKNGLYAYGSAGGNANAFLFGGGLDFITKKDTEIGYLYQRFGNQNFHSIKVGVKLFNKNK